MSCLSRTGCSLHVSQDVSSYNDSLHTQKYVAVKKATRFTPWQGQTKRFWGPHTTRDRRSPPLIEPPSRQLSPQNGLTYVLGIGRVSVGPPVFFFMYVCIGEKNNWVCLCVNSPQNLLVSACQFGWAFLIFLGVHALTECTLLIEEHLTNCIVNLNWMILRF